MTTNAAPQPAAAKRAFTRLPAILILVAIGVGQVLVAVVFLRSVPEGTAQASSTEETAAAAPAPEPKHEVAETAHDEHDVETEVDLDGFSMTVPLAKSRPLLVSFHLFGTISESKHAEFTQRFEAHRHRLRQEVIVLVRGANIAVLTDPDLTELKKLLLARLNRLLGKASLNDVVFSDFAIMEN